MVAAGRSRRTARLTSATTGCAGGGPGVAEEDGVRPEANRLRGYPFRRIRGAPAGFQVRVEQPDFVAVVDQRPANGEQPERREMVVGDAASDRGVRDVQEQDSHEAKVGRPAGKSHDRHMSVPSARMSLSSRSRGLSPPTPATT